MRPDAPDAALGHSFRSPELLRQALTHRSFAADHNERLEFIGDGVLNCAIALMLYDRFPQLPEGDLSRMRASLVNRDTLHRHAVALGLGAALKLGEGEVKSGGAARPSILADALEAVERIYAAEVADAATDAIAKDPKTRLQEWLQRRRMAVPDYAIVAVHGEAHLQTFEVVCRIGALHIEATGTGASRRAAEQAAAAQAYEQVRHS